MKRVVVDTNVFISSVFWRGKPRQVINVFSDRLMTLVLSDDIVNEIERKLRSGKFTVELAALGLSVEAIMTSFLNAAEVVTPAFVPEDAVRTPSTHPLPLQSFPPPHSLDILLC